MSEANGQAVANIGLVGHVDHGKTSVTKALSGVWTDTHSESLKRGITIKLGYADVTLRKCPKCEGSGAYTTAKTCPHDGSETAVLRKISLLDAPGHETLMATVIAASSIMDGALLVIAADEDCPQPQTAEHLMVLDVLGAKNIVIVQNKIDLVDEKKARENYDQIRAFVNGTSAEHAPVIPVAANLGVNVDALIEAMEERLPTPKRDAAKPPRFYVARSFDINKPGTPVEQLRGGVLGGSLIEGRLRAGDELEIRPGVKREEGSRETYEPLFATVSSLSAGSVALDEALPGGLIGIGTALDPSLTKADNLVGNLAGKPGTLPDVLQELRIEYHMLKRIDVEMQPLKMNEPLVIGTGTATTVGFVTKMKKDALELKLKRPICAQAGSKVALSRRIGQRWRLAGYGVIK